MSDERKRLHAGALLNGPAPPLEFRVPEVEDKPRPTPEQIEANKQKWGAG